MIRILGAILLCALPASAANIRGRTAAPVAGPTPALALPEVSPPATLDAALAAPGSPLATAPQPSALELAAAPLAEPTAAIAPAPQTALAHLPYQAPPSPAPGASAPSREEAQAERLPPATKTLRALADPKASASRPAEARLSAT
ncbi:MAG TPA: molecular chaperone DnaJ, partial [Elusimicrobiota bacterium]|nr:molecular chaperone DnaJ [Elusimicrobiota bacterium]